MNNLSGSRSQEEESSSHKQLSYSRLGAEIDQEEYQSIRNRTQTKKLLELTQKLTKKQTDQKCLKESNFVSDDLKINDSCCRSKLGDLAISNSHQQSKQKPISHLIITQSGLEKHKKVLKAITEKHEEEGLGSSEKSILTSQIMKKVTFQNACHSSQVYHQNNKNQKIIQAQSLTHRNTSNFQNKNVMIRAIDDTIQLDIDQGAELIHTSDRFNLAILPQVKQEVAVINKIPRQIAMLASLTTQSKKNGDTDELKKSHWLPQEANKKVQKETDILQNIKNLYAIVCQLKQKREIAERQEHIYRKQITKKLEEQIIQIKKRLSRLQNHQKTHSKLQTYRELKTNQIPELKINFLQQFLKDKVWQKLIDMDKLQVKYKFQVLRQILIRLNINIGLEIVEYKDQIVALCSSNRQLSVIASRNQFYFGPFLYVQQKFIKQGYGLSFLPKTQAYLGNFNKNNRYGKGLLIINQRQIYQGQFLNNFKHGCGKHLFTSGEVYQGKYQKNKFHGEGLYIWKSGDFYEGQFRRGKMEGKGRWWSRNGDKYIGEFNNNLKQGWGLYTYANGKQIEGYFYKGKKLKDKLKHIKQKKQSKPQLNLCKSYSSIKPIKFSILNLKNNKNRYINSSAQRFRVNFN